MSHLTVEEQCCKELSKIRKVLPQIISNAKNSRQEQTHCKTKENFNKALKSKIFPAKNVHEFMLALLVIITLKGQP